MRERKQSWYEMAMWLIGRRMRRRMRRKGKEVKTGWNGAVEKRGSRRSAELALLFLWLDYAHNNAERQ